MSFRDLTEDSDEEDKNKIPSFDVKPSLVKKEKIPMGNSSSTDSKDDDVVLLVAAPEEKALPSQGQMLEDGIEVLRGIPQLPHVRSDCTRHKFSHEEANQFHSPSVDLKFLVNAIHCEKCYCYVCDVNASECLEWRTHCHGELSSSSFD